MDTVSSIADGYYYRSDDWRLVHLVDLFFDHGFTSKTSVPPSFQSNPWLQSKMTLRYFQRKTSNHDPNHRVISPYTAT